MTTPTTPATVPEHFPRYCVMCQTGFWDGYLCEDSGDAYCGVECAAKDHGMTAQQLTAELDVWAAANYSAETETVVYYTDWRDIDPADYDDMPEPADDPHEEFDAHEVEGTLVADSLSGRLSVTADDRDTRQPIRRALMPGWTVTIQDGTGDVFPLTYWVPTVAEALAAVEREAAEYRRTYPKHTAEGTFTVLNIEAR